MKQLVLVAIACIAFCAAQSVNAAGYLTGLGTGVSVTSYMSNNGTGVGKAIREEDLWKYNQKKIAVLNFIPSASKRANLLLEEYELVALGEFTAVSEPDENDLKPRLVIGTFRVDEPFKGLRNHVRYRLSS